VEPEEVLERQMLATDRGDLDAVAALWAPEFTRWLNVTGQEYSRDEALALYATALRPDMVTTHEEHDRVTVGDRVVVRGTRHISIGGAPPFSFPYCAWFTIRDDQIVKIHEYIDSGRLASFFDAASTHDGMAARMLADVAAHQGRSES
jgi:ketosteroid isomerase-like protein